MKIGGRNLSVVLGAIGQRRHYEALARLLRDHGEPLAFLSRYLLRSGCYPWRTKVTYQDVSREVVLYHREDIMTLNEIFFRRDYNVSPSASLVVDVGSNIGLSALFFLLAAPRSRIYCYEALSVNVERARKQLIGFEDRYVMQTTCVGSEAGTVSFGVEESGRYGGINVALPQTLTLPCIAIDDVLTGIFEREGWEKRIDLLKLDIEGMELAVIRSIAPSYLEKIDRIVAEVVGSDVVLPGFTQTQRGLISSWSRKSPG